jgi:hypothetical protein
LHEMMCIEKLRVLSFWLFLKLQPSLVNKWPVVESWFWRILKIEC